MPRLGNAEHDVWTDAGREPGDEWLILCGASNTRAYMLVQYLQMEGWAARMESHDQSRTATEMPGNWRRPQPRPAVVNRRRRKAS
jgi:hypothetical protein